MVEASVVDADDFVGWSQSVFPFVSVVEKVNVGGLEGSASDNEMTYNSVLIKPWILSATIVSWLTGFMEDSDTSSMIDQ